jgi:hypothetical protein
MLPNEAAEGDIAHARRFYDREIAEIFSGWVLDFMREAKACALLAG